MRSLNLLVECKRATALLGILSMGGLALAAGGPVVVAPVPKTILMDGAFLARLRHQGDPAVLREVRAGADQAMKSPLVSVLDKQATPPSGDKHDYMSLSPYFWPNPATPNHLPYVRRDGQHNPEA